MMLCRRSANVSSRILSRRSQPSSFAWNSLRHFSASSSSSSSKEEQEKKDVTPPPTKPSPVPASILPGIGLSAVTALGGFQIASSLSSALSVPISGIPVAILLGMAVNNATGYGSSDPVLKSGITFSTKTILQTGIVCVAAKLSFLELLTTGSTGIPVVLASVGAGMLFIPAAGKLAGLPHQMTLLLTAGTSICGVHPSMLHPTNAVLHMRSLSFCMSTIQSFPFHWSLPIADDTILCFVALVCAIICLLLLH
jgi:hypothetical protein